MRNRWMAKNSAPAAGEVWPSATTHMGMGV